MSNVACSSSSSSSGSLLQAYYLGQSARGALAKGNHNDSVAVSPLDSSTILSLADPIHCQLLFIKAQTFGYTTDPVDYHMDNLQPGYPSNPVLCDVNDARSQPHVTKRGTFFLIRGVTDKGISVVAQLSGYKLPHYYDICSTQEPSDIQQMLKECVLKSLHQSFVEQKFDVPYSYDSFCESVVFEHLCHMNGYNQCEPDPGQRSKSCIREQRIYARVNFCNLGDWYSARRAKAPRGEMAKWRSHDGRQSGECLPVAEPYGSPESWLCELTGIQMSGWVTIRGGIVVSGPDEQDLPSRFSYAGIEVYVDRKTGGIATCELDGYTERIAPLTKLSYDIECYTPRVDNKGNPLFPSSDNLDDPVIQIGVIVEGPLESSPLRLVFCLGEVAKPDDLSSLQVLYFPSEATLLRAFAVFVQSCHPEILTGFNILGFDNQYMQSRSELLRVCDFNFLGIMIREKTPFVQSELNSNALGDNVMWHPSAAPLCTLDVFNWFKSYFKCDKYSLDYLSKKFLNNSKVDLGYAEMMKLYASLEDGPSNKLKIAEYCVKDCELPLRLLEKVDVVETLIELSRVTHTDIGRICTKGQTEKVMNQILRVAHERKTLVTFREQRPKQKYEGALVLNPKIGFYNDPVVVMDFEALYPSLVMALNMCYSTQIPSWLDMQTEEQQHVIIEAENQVPTLAPPKAEDEARRNQTLREIYQSFLGSIEDSDLIAKKIRFLVPGPSDLVDTKHGSPFSHPSFMPMPKWSSQDIEETADRLRQGKIDIGDEKNLSPELLLSCLNHLTGRTYVLQPSRYHNSE